MTNRLTKESVSFRVIPFKTDTCANLRSLLTLNDAVTYGPLLYWSRQSHLCLYYQQLCIYFSLLCSCYLTSYCETSIFKLKFICDDVTDIPPLLFHASGLKLFTTCLFADSLSANHIFQNEERFPCHGNMPWLINIRCWWSAANWHMPLTGIVISSLPMVIVFSPGHTLLSLPENHSRVARYRKRRDWSRISGIFCNPGCILALVAADVASVSLAAAFVSLVLR